MPERVAEFLAGDKADSKIKQLHPKDLENLISQLKGMEIPITGKNVTCQILCNQRWRRPQGD